MKTLPHSYTGPGLVDIQNNGHAGLDFNSDPAKWTVRESLRIVELLHSHGIVAICPTLITDDQAVMAARAKRYGEILSDEPALAEALPKLHIEGPFISPADGPRGAHPRRHCAVPQEAPDFIDRLQAASGDRVGIVTIAPELPGATELIRRCSQANIRVAIGHTQATNDQLAAAVEAGAIMSTHLGNGSAAMLPRLDNYVQTQLADERLWASFIADGHHMPLTTLKNFIRAKTVARSVLVSDAIAAAGMGPGKYTLAGKEVAVSPDGRVAAPGASNLAGSVLTLDRAVVNAHLHCGVSFKEAWRMASTNPAELVGLPRPKEITVRICDGEFATT